MEPHLGQGEWFIIHDTCFVEPGILENNQVIPIKGNTNEGFLVTLSVPQEVIGEGVVNG